MFIPEVCLLQAIRDKLIVDLALTETQCNVELDNNLPDYAPKTFVAVSPAGVTNGPRHRSSGGVIDVLVNVKVTVYQRVAEVARDKRSSVFMKLLVGLAPVLDKLVRSLDMNYTVLQSAKAVLEDLITELDIAGDVPPHLLAVQSGSWEEPLRTFSPDISARMVYRDPYDAAAMAGPPADPIVAVARSITFSGARWVQVRSTWAQ